MTQAELSTSTALTVATTETLALYPARDMTKLQAVRDVLAIEAQTASGVSPFDLQRIKMPTGGNLAWSVPTAAGEEPMKSFEGIILDWIETRVYWEGTIDKTGGGQPPDCQAEDGVHGSGRYGVGSTENRSGLCKTCPMAQWGSKEGGRGQACRSVRQVAILRPGELLPTLLFLSPASLRPFRQYVFSLASKAIAPSQAVTSFGLIKAQSGGGVPYAQVAPKLAALIPPNEREWVDFYLEQMMPAFKNVAQGAFIDDEDDDR
jgi:hypothetical protein